MNDKIIDALIERFNEGKNILITGQAGVGKTFILNEFLEYLYDEGVTFALAGSTGVAALNIGGTTAHRLFGINRASSIEDFENLRSNEFMVGRTHKSRMMELAEIEVIVIDEISMIGKELLELFDYVLKKAFKTEEPFGGKQIIFSGDFLQLPPIKDDFAFLSPVWKDAKFSVVHLTKVHRQDDPTFLEVLSKLRVGIYDEQVEKFIDDRIWNGPVDDSATKLYSRNKSVDKENEEMLKSLPGKSKTYEAEAFGYENDINSLSKSILAPESLTLKVGAKVMSLKNDEDLLYVNGSIGTVTKMNPNSVEVLFEDGEEATITRSSWSLKNTKGEEIASIEQIPLKLAYAITMHKSQGMSIDGELFVDCDGIRTPGQFYVAISRVRDFKKLKIVNFKRSFVEADKTAISFYK